MHTDIPICTTRNNNRNTVTTHGVSWVLFHGLRRPLSVKKPMTSTQRTQCCRQRPSARCHYNTEQIRRVDVTAHQNAEYTHLLSVARRLRRTVRDKLAPFLSFKADLAQLNTMQGQHAVTQLRHRRAGGCISFPVAGYNLGITAHVGNQQEDRGLRLLSPSEWTSGLSNYETSLSSRKNAVKRL